MREEVIKLFQQEGGEFVSPPSAFINKIKRIKAVVFDWDGVFNDGTKRGSDGSIFSEVDAMGTNLLRYALWRINGALPLTAIITGESNPSAIQLAQRENFDFVYSGLKNKGETFASFCSVERCKPEEVLFFFDDVLDLAVANLCGGRILVSRSSSAMLTQFVRDAAIADYITAHDGGRHGLREGAELVIGLMGQYEEVVRNRMAYSQDYQNYLSQRKKIATTHIEGAH